MSLKVSTFIGNPVYFKHFSSSINQINFVIIQDRMQSTILIPDISHREGSMSIII